MRKRIISYIIGGVILTSAWFAIVLYPELNRENQARSELVASRSYLAELQATAGQLPTMIKTRDNQGIQVNNIETQLYSKKDISSLCDRLRQIANEQNLKIVDISPSVEELLNLNRDSNTTELQNLKLSLLLKGNFQSFGWFIEDLKHQPYFHTFDRCVISDASDETGRLTFNLDFRILINNSRGKS